jgi:hypothetical protein
MYGATGRVESVHAVLTERQRPELLKLAFQRFGERVQFARGGGYFHIAAGGGRSGTCSPTTNPSLPKAPR